ncbi:hypothetical protein KB151_000827 [[Clostridium] innocuum]|nr:hypothetical protein [[Clostridium] innocuum]
MKLLSIELLSDAEGNLIVPCMNLCGLESDAPFTIHVCMNEDDEAEGDNICIPQVLLEEANIDPFAGLQVMTGDGIVAVCQSDQCDVIKMIAGGK